jgi:hypothetical protein
MAPKWFIWFCVFFGSTIGGFLPVYFGADTLSFSAIIGSTIGGILGIWAAVKIGNDYL